ncbi:pyrroline-5-carboxylate reductase [Bordetella sp. BOR01]|nr:pyrroline-5-carboxylate reductase [Bordetella sp. BOR01]
MTVDDDRRAGDQEPEAPAIGFIGGGQMATALIAGLLHAGWDAKRIIAVEPDDAQRQKLAASTGIRTLPAAAAALAEAGVVVWAVKPQALAAAIASVAPVLGAPLHVSIVAGISTDTLAARLQSDRIVRVMPNTPALVGAGVLGMLATPGVTPPERQWVENLMAATGHTFWVDCDERIDAVTAATGSGPGYVFYFLECYQSAVEALGFSKEQARELVLRTAAGAVKQADSDDTPFAVLRERVTSKGGTTAAGLRVLDEYRLPAAVAGALQGAYARAQALSRT